MDSSLLEQRSTQDVLVCTRTYRIEAKSREYIPCRSLTVVFVTTISIRCRSVHTIHHFAQPVLSLPWSTTIVVHVNHVLDRLVTMCVVTHVHHSHFSDFVDWETIVAIIIDRWNGKYRVEHLNVFFLTAHQVNQTLRIVEYRPTIVPAVTFSKVTTPLQWREFFRECTIFLLTAHQLIFRTVEVLVVLSTLFEQSDFFCRAVQFLGQLKDTPVIVSIFQ